jgi:hypothetical protein
MHVGRIPEECRGIMPSGRRRRIWPEKFIWRPERLPLQGPSGVVPPEQDGEQNYEASFAMHIARKLNHGALTSEYADLVLVADPQTLGQMRPQLHKETLARLRGEIAKTLTNSPLEDIAAVLD